jgi:tetratricopeptide (TPR) repeat protein
MSCRPTWGGKCIRPVETHVTVARSVPVTLALVLCALASPVSAQRARLIIPMKDLEAAVTRDSLDPLAHYNVALGYWTKGRWADVERSLRRAVAIEPKLAPAYLALAFLPFARQPKLWEAEEKKKVRPEWTAQLEESSRFFRLAFQLDPMVDLQVFGLAVPPRGAIIVGRNATPTYAALVQGFESLWDGQYNTAYGWLDPVLTKLDRGKPEDVPEGLLWYHGLAAAHLQKYDVALMDFQRLFDRAVARERSDSLLRTFIMESNEIRYVLATVSRLAGRGDQALELYQESVANDLGLFMGHVQMADIYEERRQWNEAITERQRALEVSPENPSLHYDLGYTLARALLFKEAAESLEEAARLNPFNPRTPYLLGLVYLRLADSVRARDSFGRFISMAPSRFAQQVLEARQHLAQQ